MFVSNIFLTFVIKYLINEIHETFLKPILYGFRTHHILTFIKRFQNWVELLPFWDLTEICNFGFWHFFYRMDCRYIT